MGLGENSWYHLCSYKQTNKQTDKQTNKKAAKPEFKNIHIILCEDLKERL
jgi:hypothetical protein